MSSVFGLSRTPPGVRELKLPGSYYRYAPPGRTPPGVRELKLCELEREVIGLASHPSRGA